MRFSQLQALEELRARREIMRLSGKRHRPRGRVPRQLQPDNVRRWYFAELLEFVRYMARVVQREVIAELPATIAIANRREDGWRADAPGGKRVNAQIQRAAQLVTQEFGLARLQRMAEVAAVRTSEQQRQQFLRQVRSVIGVDLARLPERGIAGKIEDFVAENVSLIQSVQTRYLGQVQQVVLSGISQGKLARDIANDLQERVGVAESSAKLIARDQIGKFHGELNKVRQSALGVTRYTWQTSNDNRVRDEHAEREGEIFEWDDPPEDGHPGQAINCRCQAIPVIDDVLEAL